MVVEVEGGERRGEEERGRPREEGTDLAAKAETLERIAKTHEPIPRKLERMARTHEPMTKKMEPIGRIHEPMAKKLERMGKIHEPMA